MLLVLLLLALVKTKERDILSVSGNTKTFKD